MHEGTCATLIIAFTVACGFAATLMLSGEETHNKIRSDIILGIAYCMICSAYVVCITAPYEEEDEIFF